MERTATLLPRLRGAMISVSYNEICDPVFQSRPEKFARSPASYSSSPSGWSINRLSTWSNLGKVSRGKQDAALALCPRLMGFLTTGSKVNGMSMSTAATRSQHCILSFTFLSFLLFTFDLHLYSHIHMAV